MNKENFNKARYLSSRVHSLSQTIDYLTAGINRDSQLKTKSTTHLNELKDRLNAVNSNKKLHKDPQLLTELTNINLEMKAEERNIQTAEARIEEYTNNYNDYKTKLENFNHHLTLIEDEHFPAQQ